MATDQLDAIPPPPEGFRIVSPGAQAAAQAGDIPPPPEGFRIVQPGAPAPTPAAAPAQGPPQTQEQPGLIRRALRAVGIDGSQRTEFPDAQEFLPALEAAARARGEAGTYRTTPHINALGQSAITPDPAAQLDILKAQIPGLEHRNDRFGNLMLRAPSQGVTEWTYLNAPGLSRRDLEEFGVQGLASLPFLAVGGVGAGLATRALTGAAAMGANSVAQDVAAGAAGSQQGVDIPRAAVSAVAGGALAPGVPSAALRGAGAVASQVPIVGQMPRAIIDHFNPERGALQRVGTALSRDAAAGRNALTDAERQLAAAHGLPAMTVDTGGDATRNLMRSATNANAEALGEVSGALANRFEGQSERIGQVVQDVVGQASPGAHAIQATTTGNKRATLPPIYTAAYNAGASGTHTPVLQQLLESPVLAAERAAATEALQRKQLAGTLATPQARGREIGIGASGMPTLEYWDQVVRSLSDQISRTQSGLGRAPELGRDLVSIRERLINELDRAFPTYGAARGTAATFFGATDALEAGQIFARQNFSATAKTIDHTVNGNRVSSQGMDAVRAAIAGMPQEQRDLFRQGFVSHTLERLAASPDRRNVVNQLVGSPQARQKLEVALGPNSARELEAVLHIEDVFNLPRNAMGNSTTVRQWLDAGFGAAAGSILPSGDPTSPNYLTGVAGILAAFAARRGINNVDAAVLQNVARYLVSTDPAVRQRALASVAHSPFLAQMRAVSESMPGRVVRNEAVSGAANAAYNYATEPSPMTRRQ